MKKFLVLLITRPIVGVLALIIACIPFSSLSMDWVTFVSVSFILIAILVPYFLFIEPKIVKYFTKPKKHKNSIL